MYKIDQETGQRIDYNENKDNVPTRYSAPSREFKDKLKYFADSDCSRCGGTGYIGRFKSIEAGRCFACLPDYYWEQLIGETHHTGVNPETNEAEYQIRYFSEEAYDGSGYGIFEVDFPPTSEFESYSTLEDAFESAKDKFGF